MEESIAKWERFKREHPPGTRVSGTVTNAAPFGVFVDLGVPFKALLLVPYMRPVGVRKSFPTDYPKVGDAVVAFVRFFGDPISPHGAGEISLTQDVARVDVEDVR